jgi:hypothetical protein
MSADQLSMKVQAERTGDGTEIRENKLRQLFGSGDIYLVTDDEWLGLAATYYGMKAVVLGDAEDVPYGSNVVLLLQHNLVTVDIRKTFRDSAVLLAPIASFDAGLEAALYTQKLMMLSDYEHTYRLTRYWADSVASQPGPLVFSGPKVDGSEGAATNLVCTLGDDITADAWLKPKVSVGDWISVGTLCEFSMTAPSDADWTGAFIIDGTAVASGALVARDARYDEAGDARIADAVQLRDELVANAPIVLRLEAGVLTSVRAGGMDYTDAVRRVTNPDYGLHTLELGIGTNMAVLPHVNWRFNSQLNEGAGVVHLGFGEGITGAHMDFVIAEGEHKFMSVG